MFEKKKKRKKEKLEYRTVRFGRTGIGTLNTWDRVEPLGSNVSPAPPF